jgi:hypothetical protein
MLTGFTGISSSYLPCTSVHQVVALADLWTTTEHGSHQEPAGNTVHCESKCFCTGFVRWCRSECDNGEKGVWHADGGCWGIAGLYWSIW